jgi:hypothetical protein
MEGRAIAEKIIYLRDMDGKGTSVLYFMYVVWKYFMESVFSIIS